MICLHEVSKTIGGRLVLDSVSATFREGSVVGLQGINGSGKTMLLRVIAGLVRPTKGTVRIDGKRLGKDIPMPESMGILIEAPAFLDSYTGIDNLSLLASLRGRCEKQSLEQVLVAVGLDPDDRRKFRKYSLGMKQRLGIAAAIMADPAIVLLDEPTNALDEEGVSMLRKAIVTQRERGATVVVASHDRYFLEDLSDVVLTCERGRVHQGS